MSVKKGIKLFHWSPRFWENRVWKFVDVTFLNVAKIRPKIILKYENKNLLVQRERGEEREREREREREGESKFSFDPFVDN